MGWFELKIYTTHQAIEAVANMLYKLDINGVIIEDPEDSIYLDSESDDWDYIDFEEVKPIDKRPAVIGYVSKIKGYEDIFNFLTEEMMSIKKSGLDVGVFEIQINEVDNHDWENEWKKYYKPFNVGKSLYVCPSWEKIDRNINKIVISIDPGGAFGSGIHETTSTCMEALEEYLNKGDSVFDIGCGSGILSITAAKLGAIKVTGVDNSAVAIETAKENVKLNKVDDIVDIINGNLTDKIDDKADIVVANIIAEIIISLSEYIGNYIKDDGYFITSGIINGKRQGVVDELEKYNFKILKIVNKGEWNTIVSKKR